MSKYNSPNQQPAERQNRYRNPDFLPVEDRQFAVRRAGVIVKATAEKRGFDTFEVGSSNYNIGYKPQASTMKQEVVTHSSEEPVMSGNMVKATDIAAHDRQVRIEALEERNLAYQREQLVDEELARSAVEAANTITGSTQSSNQNSVLSVQPDKQPQPKPVRTQEEIDYLETAQAAVQASYEKAV